MKAQNPFAIDGSLAPSGAAACAFRRKPGILWRPCCALPVRFRRALEERRLPERLCSRPLWRMDI